jgi:hypothetical protein
MTTKYLKIALPETFVTRQLRDNSRDNVQDVLLLITSSTTSHRAAPLPLALAAGPGPHLRMWRLRTSWAICTSFIILLQAGPDAGVRFHRSCCLITNARQRSGPSALHDVCSCNKTHTQ